MMRAGPYPSARTFLACSTFLKILYRFIFVLGDVLRFWRRPQRYDPDLLKLWHDINWYYKSARPITRPEKGRGESEYFRRYQIHQTSLLPHGLIEQGSLTISAVGDLMSPGGTENSRDMLYENVSELIFGTDVSIANLESTPVDGEIEETQARLGEAPKINCSLEQFNTLKGHKDRSYSILTLSNNHILDSSFDGMRFIWNLLQVEGIHGIGINWTPQAQGLASVFEHSGFRLGFATGTYSVNLREYPDGRNYLVNEVQFHKFRGTVDLSVLESQLADCRDKRCDFAIAVLHWGMEFELYPRWSQIEIAHHLAERGADLIISHHPHNIQPFELYRTIRDPHRIVPITYSLGNLSSIFASPFCSLSIVLNLKLIRGMLPSGNRGTFVGSMMLTPVVQTVFSEGGKTKLRIERLAEMLCRTRQQNKKQRRFFAKAAKYADIVLGTEWRVMENLRRH
jgi:hypothetical protein